MARPRCFVDVNIGEEPAGRLTIELFTDKTPKTCENFRQLCTGEQDGLSYQKAPFHRVIDEFMVQGGDIQNGDGTGRISIYGAEFEDENLNWREMDAAGLVCSANSGKDTNGCQFFITLEPCPHLNGKHTIFGRLVAGEDALQRIASVPTDGKDRPNVPVLVSRCGELERRKKGTAHQPQTDTVSEEYSRVRGRRQRSTDRDVEMEDSPEPRTLNKNRRQSDNVVDEGLRGRPRQRSGSRSPSRPLSTPSEDDDDETGDSTDRSSPTKMHKRKRSASPSRHGDGERRRRSLPNQYRDGRFNKPREDEDRYRPSPRRDDYRHPSRRHNDDPRYPERRQDDRYRPTRERNQHHNAQEDHGRLGGGSYDEHEPPVKFKGRGVMKYQEPGRLS